MSEWEEAKEWFNNLDTVDRNNMVMIMYRLCMKLKDKSHAQIIETMNASWQEKVNAIETNFMKQKEQLELENKKYKNGESTSIIVNHLNKLENEINGLSLKITPSSNGKLGEDYIENLLNKIPGARLSNLTQMRGNGDFLLEINNRKMMIESKNWTNSSIRGNPREIELFKETAIAAREEMGIDCAIMALHRVTDIRGKTIELETVYTKKGSLILIYVTNLFNYPDRILYAIDSGLLLLDQRAHNSIDRDKFIYQINFILKIVENLEESIKERSRHMKASNELIKKDIDNLNLIKTMFDEIADLPLNEQSSKNKIIKICADLIKLHGEKLVTKKSLENACLEMSIPIRLIRDEGGIKEIKRLAVIEINKVVETSDASVEANAETNAGVEGSESTEDAEGEGFVEEVPYDDEGDEMDD